MLSPVAIFFELEPQLKYSLTELWFEAVSVGILPLLVQNFERYILVGRSSSNPDEGKIEIIKQLALPAIPNRQSPIQLE